MYTQKFVNLAWVLTFLLFFATLMASYAFLPEKFGLSAEAWGTSVDREVFFYVTLAVFVVVNLAALILRRMLEALPLTSAVYARNELFKTQLITWLGGLMSAVNVCLVTLIGYVSLFNNQEDFSMDGFSFLLYLGPILLGVCAVWFISIFSSRRRYEVNQ